MLMEQKIETRRRDLNVGESEMIAYALFGLMAILTTLSISGSLFHILGNLDN